ncbi:hypothetical protein PtA15_5A292 [Puccinia triticina]|uniref:Uncharacterized protein n=1 Tax=Puccinia triticina TaxID=208348 RepID=A0ABY7CHJ8_9BASI|nr:uncharacterized protein PtA15_5A292 [Puccinia triticina]WAQ84719.1 hypothetical protein PtA15_5A292 [Puccinia triticina]
MAVDEPKDLLATEVPEQLAPILEPDQLLGAFGGLEIVDDVINYNCSRFHKATNYDRKSPAVLLVSLKTALFYVTEQSSLYTSSCLLKLDCMLIELIIAQGLNPSSPPQKIAFEHTSVLNSLPKTTQTVMQRLAIEPDLLFFVCCPSCFATYPDGSTGPERCTHRLPDDSEESTEPDGTGVRDKSRKKPYLCGTPLFKDFASSKPTPVRCLAIQDLYSWLGRLFSREGIEDALNQTAVKSQAPYDASLDHTRRKVTRIIFWFSNAGELEITYLTNFGQVGNLRALLQSGNLPASLEPFVQQIRELYEPIPFVPQSQVQHRQSSLEHNMFSHLVTRLNELFPLNNCEWVPSDEWHKAKSKSKLAPVNSLVQVVSNFKRGEEIFMSMQKSKKNCAVALKPDAKIKYGMIDKIFVHSRTPPGLLLQTDTWLAVKPLHPVPRTNNPFAQLSKYAFNVSLRTLEQNPIYIVHSDKVLAHCAWLKYRPGELNSKITYETYALVCLNR